MRWLKSITESMDKNLSKLGDSEGQESLVCCIHGITEWTRLGK